MANTRRRRRNVSLDKGRKGFFSLKRIKAWESKWGKLTEFREKVAPAYLKAALPVLLNNVSFVEKRGLLEQGKLMILVVGGGKGFFSRRVLPGLRRSFGDRLKIQVTESDLYPVVQHAPKSSHRLMARFEEMPFINNSFDMIVGQSVAHQPGFLENLHELKRVLSKTGVIVHFQDDIPVGTEFHLKFDALAKVGMLNPKTLRSLHSEYARRIAEAANRAGMGADAEEIYGEEFIDARGNFKEHAGKDLDKRNHIAYHFGSRVGFHEPGVSKGKKKITYKGIAVMMGPIIEPAKK